MLGVGVGVGAADHEAPVGPGGQRGPHLLAVDDPLVAVEVGLGLHVGQVGAGVGLGVALAPAARRREDAGQEAVLLLVGAEGDEGRPEQALAHEADPAGRLGPGVLLVPDDLLGDGQAVAAVLLGPADADPALAAEELLPLEAALEVLVLLARPAEAPQRGEVARQMGLEEVPGLGPERLVLVAEPEVHGPSLPSPPVPRTNRVGPACATATTSRGVR